MEEKFGLCNAKAYKNRFTSIQYQITRNSHSFRVNLYTVFFPYSLDTTSVQTMITRHGIFIGYLQLFVVEVISQYAVGGPNTNQKKTYTLKEPKN